MHGLDRGPAVPTASVNRVGALALLEGGMVGVCYYGLHDHREDHDGGMKEQSWLPTSYWHQQWVGRRCPDDAALLDTVGRAKAFFMRIRRLCRDGRTTWVSEFWGKDRMDPMCENQFAVIEIADDEARSLIVRFAEAVLRAREVQKDEGDPEKWTDDPDAEPEFWFTEERILICRSDGDLVAAVARAKGAFLKIQDLGRQNKGRWL